MGLADIARAKQIQKQLDRLQSVQDAEERDRHAYKFATYQGKDPVDGTDIVEVNGARTSGFKLISNAPLSIGDRVNLRPNQQGLQRVDAKNVAPIPKTIIEPKKLIFINADIEWGFVFVFDYSIEITGYDDTMAEIFNLSESKRDYTKGVRIATSLYSDPERIANPTFITENTFFDGTVSIDFIDYNSNYRFVSQRFTVSSRVVSGKLMQISDVGLSYVNGLEDVYYYDYSFSTSNHAIAPYFSYARGALFSDGQDLIRSSILRSGEIYSDNIAEITWSNLSESESGGILPIFELNLGMLSAVEIALPPPPYSGLLDTDFWWRFKRSNAANWYDL